MHHPWGLNSKPFGYFKYRINHYSTSPHFITMQCKSPAEGCTVCQVETNHWALRCLWQRLIMQVSWLLGLGRPAHEASCSMRL